MIFPQGGFQTENALTRQETLRGMTIWAAKSRFWRKKKSSIEKERQILSYWIMISCNATWKNPSNKSAYLYKWRSCFQSSILILNDSRIVLKTRVYYIVVLWMQLFLPGCNSKDSKTKASAFSKRNNESRTGLVFSKQTFPTPTLNMLRYMYFYNGALSSCRWFQ